MTPKREFRKLCLSDLQLVLQKWKMIFETALFLKKMQGYFFQIQ